MFYNSTRQKTVSVTATEAITRGISAEGGLFVPTKLPQWDATALQTLVDADYQTRAIAVLTQFLGDFTAAEIDHCVVNAYNDKKFATADIAQLKHLHDQNYMLELWHGPTCAFKDMALQILPYLLTTSAKKAAAGKKMVILVATSGDTGKAALEGFKDVEDTQMLVFYPEDGVSNMQKRQMVTQEGSNVGVCAIKGNFDDAQSGVKQIFTDPAMLKTLADNGMMFSSANSINWGRLLPQIVYYISTYCEMVKTGAITMGEVLNVVVPTGNFGNILAAYYAKQMGVPLGKLICASNQNNVLTDFIRTGTYDRNRPFFTTTSPSMDILISSNLERLLYDLTDCDDEKIADWFTKLSDHGSYTVDDAVKGKMAEHFYADCCDDQETAATIKAIFDRDGYTCDTHTAVAVQVCESYQKATGDTRKTIIVSTASPYKFADSVLSALGQTLPADDYEQVALLHDISGLAVPTELATLKDKPVRFTGSIDNKEMKQAVEDLLGL